MQTDLFGKHVKTNKDQKRDKEAEKNFIIPLLTAIQGPIIVHPMAMDQPPENLRQDIQVARLLQCAKHENMATEEEAMWYISTASLVAPLDHDWYEIYMYLCRKWLIKKNKELPDFLKEPITLSNSGIQENDLANLRHWIYKKQVEHVTEKIRSSERESELSTQKTNNSPEESAKTQDLLSESQKSISEFFV